MEFEGNVDDYPFKDVAFNVEAVRFLVSNIKSYKKFKMKDLYNHIRSTHINLGGLTEDVDNFLDNSFRPIVRKMYLNEGKIDYNDITKLYTLIGDNIIKPSDDTNIHSDVDQIDENNDIPSDKLFHFTDDTKEFGIGDSSVYVYSYPAYIELAKFRSQERFPCKIGKADNIISRIKNQSQMMPEYAEILIVFKTDTPLKLETVVQYILELRGYHITDAVGTEFYNSNPQEIIDIYEFITKTDVAID